MVSAIRELLTAHPGPKLLLPPRFKSQSDRSTDHSGFWALEDMAIYLEPARSETRRSRGGANGKTGISSKHS
jgi:hypothetical protein